MDCGGLKRNMAVGRQINHISLGYAGRGGGGIRNEYMYSEPCGRFDLNHVSTGSLPSIIHPAWLWRGAMESCIPHVLPRAVLAWRYKVL